MPLQAKKIKQDQLRRLMSEQKKKLVQSAKKIESPLAKYDKDGTLTCIICQSIVRSEAVWSVHLNSKKHKENVANKVKKKEEAVIEPVETKITKRPAPPPPPVVNTKKIKSILKNAPSAPVYSAPVNVERETNESRFPGNDGGEERMEESAVEESESEEEDMGSKDTLPEGFFDDPKLDAKVRNVEYKDPIEEEWEQFQKEIREETSKAQAIIAEDQEEATTERQIDEIDEQIRNWTRVVSLERKKQEVIAAPVVNSQTIKQESSSGEDSDFEEFVDWRSKRSFE